jgi:hypothetical protein
VVPFELDDWPLLKRIAKSGIMSHSILATAVTSKAEEYRAKAAECEQHAESIRDAYIKGHYQELARQWREMAEQIERMGR